MTNKFLPPTTTTATRTSSTPLDGEVFYDTDEKDLYVGDGTTTGGKKLQAGGAVADNVFRIQDNTDPTKQIAFEASGITTGTTRTFTAPDASGTLLSTDTLTDKALYYYDAASKLFKPVGIGTAGQALVAQPSSNPPYQWATASGGGRELLTANRTYYVRTDGNDSNNGLTNTSGGAFLTIQKAVDVAASLDLGIYNVTIQVGNGTYSESIKLKASLGSGEISILGDTTTPANCVIDIPVDGSGFWSDVFVGKYTIRGFKLTSTASSTGIVRGIYAQGGGTKIEYGNIEFSTLNTSGVKNHVWVQENAIVRPIASYTISAGCDYHWLSNPTGFINALLLPSPITITITGSPTISYFAIAQKTGVIDLVSTDIVFSGSCTGQRYLVVQNGVINTNGGGANYFPGSVAGTTATGGQYA